MPMEDKYYQGKRLNGELEDDRQGKRLSARAAEKAEAAESRAEYRGKRVRDVDAETAPSEADYLGRRADETPSAEPTAEETPAEESEQVMPRRRSFWRDYGYLLVTVAAVFLLFKVLMQLAYVPSGSMETTIPARSVLLSWHLPYMASDPIPSRGHVVTFWDEEMGKLLVKRVVGLPGDQVSFSGGYVYINGEQLNEPYLPRQGITSSPRQDVFQVPEGCVFVMGDNRDGSHDSRYLDEPYIPLSAIQARVMVCISVFKDNSWQGIHRIG